MLWLTRIHSMELKVKISSIDAYSMSSRIHSMELKGLLTLPGVRGDAQTRNPFNGIESVHNRVFVQVT